VTDFTPKLWPALQSVDSSKFVQSSGFKGNKQVSLPLREFTTQFKKYLRFYVKVTGVDSRFNRSALPRNCSYPITQNFIEAMTKFLYILHAGISDK